MGKRANKHREGRSIIFVVGIIASISAVVAYLLQGKDVALLQPKGYIAQQQLNLFLFTLLVLLAIGIPTLIIFYTFAWKYRETNTKVSREMTHQSKFATLSMWAIPLFFMVALTTVLWPATHNLAPQKSLAEGENQPLTIQVVALRWKWLFIYPNEKIATVNYVQIPNNTPVVFDMTADEAPMNSFWIPHLGGQLYAMTGHNNRLNLKATEIGEYTGKAAEINGDGFSGMTFTTRVSTADDYDKWVVDVRQNSPPLTTFSYQKLLVPTVNNDPEYFAYAQTDLYATILAKYEGDASHGHSKEQTHE